MRAVAKLVGQDEVRGPPCIHLAHQRIHSRVAVSRAPRGALKPVAAGLPAHRPGAAGPPPERGPRPGAGLDLGLALLVGDRAPRRHPSRPPKPRSLEAWQPAALQNPRRSEYKRGRGRGARGQRRRHVVESRLCLGLRGQRPDSAPCVSAVTGGDTERRCVLQQGFTTGNLDHRPELGPRSVVGQPCASCVFRRAGPAPGPFIPAPGQRVWYDLGPNQASWTWTRGRTATRARRLCWLGRGERGWGDSLEPPGRSYVFTKYYECLPTIFFF